MRGSFDKRLIRGRDGVGGRHILALKDEIRHWYSNGKIRMQCKPVFLWLDLIPILVPLATSLSPGADNVSRLALLAVSACGNNNIRTWMGNGLGKQGNQCSTRHLVSVLLTTD
jgi:hypothetical protein